MKKLEMIGLCSLAMVFEYLLGAFVQVNINPTLWSIDARMAVALMFAVSFVLTTMIMIDSKGN